MKIEKIYDFLNAKFPTSLAEAFDNVGLLIGDKTADIKSAVLALDCTDRVVDFAIENGCGLIITHHPVIFQPLKQITADSIVYRLVQNGISVISMHTNLDTALGGVNDCLCDALDLKDISVLTADDGFTIRKGLLENELTADDFAVYVSEKLNTAVKYVGAGCINTVAVCSGSGGDFLDLAIQNGADALVTADVKHSKFLEAVHLNFTLLDAGHFNTEDVVIEPLALMLKNEFPSVEFICEHSNFIKVVTNNE